MSSNAAIPKVSTRCQRWCSVHVLFVNRLPGVLPQEEGSERLESRLHKARKAIHQVKMGRDGPWKQNFVLLTWISYRTRRHHPTAPEIVWAVPWLARGDGRVFHRDGTPLSGRAGKGEGHEKWHVTFHDITWHHMSRGFRSIFSHLEWTKNG